MSNLKVVSNIKKSSLIRYIVLTVFFTEKFHTNVLRYQFDRLPQHDLTMA